MASKAAALLCSSLLCPQCRRRSYQRLWFSARLARCAREGLACPCFVSEISVVVLAVDGPRCMRKGRASSGTGTWLAMSAMSCRTSSSTN